MLAMSLLSSAAVETIGYGVGMIVTPWRISGLNDVGPRETTGSHQYRDNHAPSRLASQGRGAAGVTQRRPERRGIYSTERPTP